MLVAQDDLLNAMENSWLMLPSVPGIIEPVSIEGIRAVWSPASDFILANLVGHVRLNKQNADSTIRAVHQFYTSRERSYHWFVADRATPADIGDRLLDAGLQRIETLAGLYMDDLLDHEIRCNPDIIIHPVDMTNRDTFIDIFSSAFGAPREFFSNTFIRWLDAGGGRHYLAYFNGEPAAAASMIYIPSRSIVVLQGAATLLNYRRRGLYSALVARRLADAGVDGMEVAVIQAARGTSAPICINLGFVELCGIEIYAWIPPR
jgi:hypothetical protein